MVRKCNRKKTNVVHSTHTHSQRVERCELSGDEDLKITPHTRSVKYRVVDGTPGLKIQSGNTHFRGVPIFVIFVTPQQVTKFSTHENFNP